MALILAHLLKIFFCILRCQQFLKRTSCQANVTLLHLHTDPIFLHCFARVPFTPPNAAMVQSATAHWQVGFLQKLSLTAYQIENSIGFGGAYYLCSFPNLQNWYDWSLKSLYKKRQQIGWPMLLEQDLVDHHWRASQVSWQGSWWLASGYFGRKTDDSSLSCRGICVLHGRRSLASLSPIQEPLQGETLSHCFWVFCDISAFIHCCFKAVDAHLEQRKPSYLWQALVAV